MEIKPTIIKLCLSISMSLNLSTNLIAQENIENFTYVNNIKSNINDINSYELNTLLEEEHPLHLIDIREKLQFERGEIFHEDLIKLTRGYLEFQIHKYIKNKNDLIVIYCCSGQRSSLAVNTLISMGYTNVYSLDGGIKKWVDNGYPILTSYGNMKLHDSY
jgi:rhodanese-related sulfurtransferase